MILFSKRTDRIERSVSLDTSLIMKAFVSFTRQFRIANTLVAAGAAVACLIAPYAVRADQAVPHQDQTRIAAQNKLQISSRNTLTPLQSSSDLTLSAPTLNDLATRAAKNAETLTSSGSVNSKILSGISIDN